MARHAVMISVLAVLALGGCSLDRSAIIGPGRADSGSDADAGSDLDAEVDSDACLPASETCDGIDQDCDGATDEEIADVTCGVGACAATVPGCVSGAIPECVPGAPAATDQCGNAIDDDCDGTVDGPSCSSELFHYDADVAPDADGWMLRCLPTCPAGDLVQEAGRVRVIGDTTGARWYTRAWSVGATGTTVAEFRVRGERYVGPASAFVAASTTAGRILVDVLPAELRVATECASVSVPVTRGADVTIRIEIAAGTARTLVDDVLVDTRPLCAVAGSEDAVVFGSGNPSGMGEISIDDVRAYTVP